ncbi:unnamed protein product [Penicillium discolor]
MKARFSRLILMDCSLTAKTLWKSGPERAVLEVSEQQWSRQNASARPYARIAQLKPDKLASYVFYHYQYQEEKPGDGDKYGMIALHENLMFFYSEDPATIEKPSYSGKLSTSHTPPDWAGTMEPHFIPWDSSDGSSRIWLEIPLVIRA